MKKKNKVSIKTPNIVQTITIPRDGKTLSRINEKVNKVLIEHKTISTGCEGTDYATLFYNIRKHKFTSILECGSGVSTIVIAYALHCNYKDTGIMGKVTSMEEIPKYYDYAVSHTPEMLKPYIEYICSPCVYDYYSIFRGRRYEYTPLKHYDFCWIDGPNFEVPINKGRHCFDFDLLYVILNDKSGKPTSAMIDGRFSTTYVMSKLFNGVSVYKNPRDRSVIGIMQPITRKNIKVKSKSEFRFLMKPGRDLDEDLPDNYVSDYNIDEMFNLIDTLNGE